MVSIFETLNEIEQIDRQVDTKLAQRIPSRQLQDYIQRQEEVVSIIPTLRHEKQIPIGQLYRDSPTPQLITIPFDKRKTFVVVGSPGSGKTVMAKTIIFDFMHKVFGNYLAVLSPKVEYSSRLMRRNTRWRKHLAKLGLPTQQHNTKIITPEFAPSVVGEKFKFDLEDFNRLGDEEWSTALYDILGVDDNPASRAVIETIKSRKRPQSITELAFQIKQLFDERSKTDIEGYFSPITLRTIYSRLMSARRYLGKGNSLNILELLTKQPVVFQSTTKQRNEFVNLYAGLFLEMIRVDRTDYVNAMREGKPTNSYLNKPVVIGIEEARFFAPSSHRVISLSKQQLIDGVKTDRDVGISYCFVEQDLSLLDELIINNVDYFVYKGVPSADNVNLIRRAFNRLEKQKIEDWVAHSYTADVDAGESPLKTTTAYIDRRTIKYGESIPSLCAIVEEST